MSKELDINSRINRAIAKAIVAAQVCSDGGKEITTVECSTGLKRGPYYMGYSLKDKYILRALKLITTTRSGFYFFVEEKPDQNGYSSVVSYFEYNYGGIKHQISFHTPYRKAEGIIDYSGKGRKTHWNNQYTSRKECNLLAEIFKL